jgi:hypothetical protein
VPFAMISGTPAGSAPVVEIEAVPFASAVAVDEI